MARACALALTMLKRELSREHTLKQMRASARELETAINATLPDGVTIAFDV